MSKQHNPKALRKIFKQMKKCPEIDEIIRTAKGYKIILQTGEFYVSHLTMGAMHPVRRWLKEKTSLVDLTW